MQAYNSAKAMARIVDFKLIPWMNEFSIIGTTLQGDPKASKERNQLLKVYYNALLKSNPGTIYLPPAFKVTRSAMFRCGRGLARDYALTNPC